MDEKQLQQKYMELQMLDSQMKQMDQQLVMVDSQVNELNGIQQALEELPKTKTGNDLFVPISQGIFVKTKLEENNELLNNVGVGVAVKKNIPEAKKILEEQIANIKKLRTQLHGNMENFAMQAKQIEKELNQNV